LDAITKKNLELKHINSLISSSVEKQKAYNTT